METRLAHLSEYRGMWIFALFDLPVKTRKNRRLYRNFRTALLKEGFTMMQYSVYARYCSCKEVADNYRKAIKAAVPPEGHVRILMVTDRQFGKMEVYYGRKQAPAEPKPQQMLLF